MKITPILHPCAILPPSQKAGNLNPAAVYLETLRSPISRLTMISPLNRAANIMVPELTGKDAWKAVPWERLKAVHVRKIMANLDGGPATKNKALAALKGVARMAWEMNLLKGEELSKIAGIKGDPGSRELAGRYVPSSEIKDLLCVCAKDAGAAGARDAAMISIAVSTGVRRAELSGMLAENIVPDEDGAFRIRIIGKRNKERTIFIRGNTSLSLRDWLTLRFATGCKTGPLFCAILKGGRLLPGKSVSPTALDKVLRKRISQAEITDLDWHDLRRTTTSNLLDAGADIAVVAGILGHANLQTTVRYDRRGERARQRATELLSIPYYPRNFRV